MRWLGGSFVVLVVVFLLAACTRNAPASDTVPDPADGEPLFAAQDTVAPATSRAPASRFSSV